VDPRVDEVVLRTLEKEREKRYQSAGEVKTKVEHLTQTPAAAASAAAGFDPAHDFILCPPQLPRMGKAIVVYALVIAPVLWLVSFFTLTPLPDHALVAFAEGAVNLITFCGEFLVLVLLAIGGWKLRAFNSGAPTWLRWAIGLHLLWMLLATAGYLWIGVLESELLPDAPLEQLSLGDGLLLAVALASVVFEISALVWLCRNREKLGHVLRTTSRPAAPRATIAISPDALVPPPPSSWSKLAIIGAALVGISLPLPLLLLAAMVMRWGGIGPLELALALVSVGLGGLTGTLLGWISLSSIRSSKGSLHGLPLAVFAALTWPLLLLLGITVGLPSILVMAPTAADAATPFWQSLFWLIPAGALTFAVWAIYTTSCWAANQPRAKGRGTLKWIFLALIVFGVALSLRPRWRESHTAQTSVTALAPLPDGMVELVALTREPSDGVWWKADGTPANEGAFEKSGASPQVGPGERAVLFIFRSLDAESHAISRTYDLCGAKTWFSGVQPRLNGKIVSGGSFVTATFPESQQTTTVRMGVAMDTWETVARDSRTASRSLVFARFGQTRKVAFLGAIEDKSGDTIVTLTHDLPEEDVRILAVDDQGNEHASTTHHATGERHQFTLPRLEPKRVREYQFQVRPYRWAEFSEVQLSPASNGPTRAPLTRPATPASSNAWMSFTFTAVEWREVDGKRWLAIDYLDEVHGEVHKSFPWESQIPNFKPEVRTSEYFKEAQTASGLRHQRVEYRLPDTVPRDSVEELRRSVEQALKHKTIKVNAGDQKVMFEFGSSSDTALKAWIKVTPASPP